MHSKIKTNIDMKEYKIQQLKELYNEYCSNSEDGQGDGMSFREYVEREADNDPRFFAWLFEEDKYEDFCDLTEEEQKEYQEFINYMS